MHFAIRQLIKLCKQDKPQFFAETTTDEEVLNCFVYAFCAQHNLFNYIPDEEVKLLDKYTIEDCERAYENGWEAVINDGKLLGFKKPYDGNHTANKKERTRLSKLMKIISNFPKKDKKVKIDKSVDIFFAVTVLFLIGMVIAFCAMVQNVEAVPDLQPKPIVSEVKEVKDIKPILVTNPTAEEVIEEAMEEPVDITQTDEYLIASVVMAESKGEEMIGKVAVASAILNRCDFFGLEVKTIINAKDQFAKGETPNEDCFRAVEIAIENRDIFPKDMLFFRNEYYHDFGKPYMQIGNHFFSTRG